MAETEWGPIRGSATQNWFEQYSKKERILQTCLGIKLTLDWKPVKLTFLPDIQSIHEMEADFPSSTKIRGTQSANLMNKLIIITTMLLLLTYSNLSLGHPGRTAADGCHQGNHPFRHRHVNGRDVPCGVVNTPVPRAVVNTPIPRPPTPFRDGHDFDGGKDLDDVHIFYSFDDNDVDRIYDDSGNNRNLVIEGENYKKIKGKFGKALSFNDLNNDAGSATTSSAKHIRIHSDDGIMVSMHIKIPNQNIKDTSMILGISNRDFTKEAVGIFRVTLQPKCRLRISSVDLIRNEQYDSRFIHDICDNKWHHILFTINSEKEALLYLDTKQEFKTKFKNEFILNSRYSFNTFISIGYRLKGMIDDLAIIETEYNPAQVRVAKNNAMKNLLFLAPVHAENRLTTTWAAIKSTR